MWFIGYLEMAISMFDLLSVNDDDILNHRGTHYWCGRRSSLQPTDSSLPLALSKHTSRDRERISVGRGTAITDGSPKLASGGGVGVGSVGGVLTLTVRCPNCTGSSIVYGISFKTLTVPQDTTLQKKGDSESTLADLLGGVTVLAVSSLSPSPLWPLSPHGSMIH